MAAEANPPEQPEGSDKQQRSPRLPPRPGGDLPIWSTERPPVDYGRVGRDLRAAIITGVLLGGAIIASLIFFKFGFILIMAALLVLATVELGHNFARRNIVRSGPATHDRYTNRSPGRPCA